MRRPPGWPADAPEPLAFQAIPIADGLGIALHVRHDYGEEVLPMTNDMARQLAPRLAQLAEAGR